MSEIIGASTYSHPLESGMPPEWASEWGDDEFGVFAGFTVGDVTHRFRWIPGGKFRMGSPKDEAGRYDTEGPVREVTLSGYWLGETPCTQALWKAVMGESENPSRFQTDDRPVEQVSWDDCRSFFDKLNSHVASLEARFPTEAEWEHACRGGALEPSSTYAGELEIDTDGNAHLLDEIAWYGRNSHDGFELKGERGTHRVMKKRPNDWGLYDMLGNVWEWCSDWWAGEYPGEPETNPTGPREGSSRVCRGGSWVDVARLCRSAARDRGSPGNRYGDLGFRLARGQSAQDKIG